jgi:signal transduction histidine kinase
MSAVLLLPAISALASLFIGFLVFLKNWKEKINRVFFIFCILITIWLVGTSLLLSNCLYLEKAIFWDRFIYIGVTLLPAAAYQLSLLFFRSKFQQQKILPFICVSSIFFLIVSRTNYFVNNLFTYRWGCHTEAQFFHHIFLIFFFLIVGVSLYNIFQAIQKSQTPIEKIQNKYAFAAFSVLSLGSFAFLPAYRIPVYPGIYLSGLFGVIILSYAILKHYLFEIRVILTEILVGVMAVILATEIFLFPTLQAKLIGLSIFLLFCLIGYLLIRHSHKEMSYREEIQKAYLELKEASKNIEELSKMKSEFLKVVSHQLRTPASIIKGMLSMIVEGSIKGEKLKEFIKKCYLSSERLTTILDDILVAQGLIGGGEPVKFSPCQIEKIVERKVEHLRVQAEMKGLKISFSKPKEPLPITLADSEMIERAISRIIDNAILYTEKGEIKISVRLKKEGEKDFIEISVKDQGIGLDEEDKKNLFKLFYRGKKATSLHPNGTGLGLFIVNEFVKIHKGKVEAKSEGRGKGSNFIIALPIITEV